MSRANRKRNRNGSQMGELIPFYTFYKYVTAEQAFALSPAGHTLKELQAQSHVNALCETCGSNPQWRYGGTGMCFPCTTGETDASEDYELEWVPR